MPSQSLKMERPFPLLMAPPPIIFAVAFGVGAAVERFVPLSVAMLPHGLRAAGLALLAAGVLLGASLGITFLRRRTTLNPFAEPSAFVVAGPYRFSRNPMYLSLVVAYLGGTLIYGSLWPLVLLVVPVAILARTVIPREEAQMAATFGPDYEAYRSRVRRWI